MIRRVLACATLAALCAHGVRGDVCSARYASYVNVFPERLYCQNTKYTLGVDGLMLGAIDAASGEQRTVNFAQAPSGTYATGVTYATSAYLSNLYNGDRSAGSPFDKRWSTFSYTLRDAGGASVEPTLVLMNVAYADQDAIEGASDRYPLLVDGAVRWTYADCTNTTQVRSQAAGGRTYVFYDAGASAPTCACQLHYAYDPHLARCVSGCTQAGPEAGQGYCGPACATLMGPGTEQHAYAFYADTTAFVNRDTCVPVCAPGSAAHNGVCQRVLTMSSPSDSNRDDEIAIEVLSLTLLGVLFGCTFAAALAVLFCIVCRRQERRSRASPPPTPRARALAPPREIDVLIVRRASGFDV